MLNAIIRFASEATLVDCGSLRLFLLVVYGGWQILQLPIDVFPDLNRPRVTLMVEAPGMAPEEVETLITFPAGDRSQRSVRGPNSAECVGDWHGDPVRRI